MLLKTCNISHLTENMGNEENAAFSPFHTILKKPTTFA